MVDRQTLASRRNGALGGPRTEEGKRRSSRNARKHGILASTLTRIERRRMRDELARFEADLCPLGAVEETLVEKIAVTYLRLQRCAEAEGEYLRAAWAGREPQIDLDGRVRLEGSLGTVSPFNPEHFERMVTLIARYDTSLTNQFMKLLHELERTQRRRLGEDVRPPALAQVDVNR